MVPQLDVLWRFLRLIPVARDGRDSGPAREAIRHVRGGSVVGIFPEGAIVTPPEQVRPFHEGAGLIIARTKAPVLLAWVTGTPDSPDMFKALLSRSRARVQFLGVVDFSDTRDARAIGDQLRRRIADASGWPINDEPLEPAPRGEDPFAAA